VEPGVSARLGKEQCGVWLLCDIEFAIVLAAVAVAVAVAVAGAGAGAGICTALMLLPRHTQLASRRLSLDAAAVSCRNADQSHRASAFSPDFRSTRLAESGSLPVWDVAIGGKIWPIAQRAAFGGEALASSSVIAATFVRGGAADKLLDVRACRLDQSMSPSHLALARLNIASGKLASTGTGLDDEGNCPFSTHRSHLLRHSRIDYM
jgi:hypothetical protein